MKSCLPRYLNVLLMLVILPLALAGCFNGDSSSGTSASATLSGTAAAGAPLAGFVYVKDKNGVEVNVAIGGNGDYSISVTGMNAPFIIKAVPGSGATLYSYAATANVTANVTPLTTLALFLSHNQGDLAALYDTWNGNFAALTTAIVQTAQAKINANFTTQMQAASIDPTTYDFLTATFVANRSGIDAVLDGLRISINFGTGTFAVTDANSVSVSFDPNISTTGIAIGGSNNGGGGTARSWQPEQTLPADRPLTQANLSVVDGAGTMALDGAGNGLVLTGNPCCAPKQGLAIRPHGGTLGAPALLPVPVGANNPYFAVITTDALGDAFAFDQYHQAIASRASGAAGMTGEPTTGTPPGVAPGLAITDVAVAPGGAAVAIGTISPTLNDRAGVVFRAAGTSSSWAVATMITLPPAQGDTDTRPVGVALDADGGALAVYRSLPSGAILQTFQPAGASGFGTPTQIPGADPSHFSHGADGTAVMGWLAGTTVHAAVRAPGQLFGAPQTVASHSSVGVDLSGERFAAGEGGHAMGVWVAGLNDYSCVGAGLTGSNYGWEAAVYTPGASGTAGTWAAAGSGAIGWPHRSSFAFLRIAGDTFALATDERDDVAGTRCDDQDDTHTSRAYVGSVAALATGTIESTSGTVVAQGTSGSSWPFAAGLAVNAAGDALFGYISRPDGTSHLVAFERPAR